jgi:hypothetical protein
LIDAHLTIFGHIFIEDHNIFLSHVRGQPLDHSVDHSVDPFRVDCTRLSFSQDTLPSCSPEN